MSCFTLSPMNLANLVKTALVSSSVNGLIMNELSITRGCYHVFQLNGVLGPGEGRQRKKEIGDARVVDVDG